MKRWMGVLLCGVLVLQAAVLFWMGHEKAYFHMDEMYSYGLTHSDVVTITDRPDFFGLHPASYFESYLNISEEEKGNFWPVYENQKNDVHPPLYYLLLRLCILAFGGGFTKWSGLLLNFLFALLSTLTAYCTARRLFDSRRWALLSAFTAAFTTAALELFLTIRMYQMSAFFLLLLTNRVLAARERGGNREYAQVAAVLLLGSLTHYHFLLFALAQLACFVWENPSRWLRTLLWAAKAGGLSLLVFPDSLAHILTGERGVHTALGLSALPEFLGLLPGVLNGLPLLLLLAFIPGKRMGPTEGIDLLWGPALFFLFAVSLSAPFVELRYLLPVCPVLILCVVSALRRVTPYPAACILLGFCLMVPLALGERPAAAMAEYRDLPERMVVLHDVPAVYLLDVRNNRLMDDLYLLTLVDQTAVIEPGEDPFAYESANGLLIFAGDGVDTAPFVEYGVFLGKTNACSLYYFIPGERKPL